LGGSAVEPRLQVGGVGGFNFGDNKIETTFNNLSFAITTMILLLCHTI
jgi:hypothetical protein